MSPTQEIDIAPVPRDQQVAALWLLFAAEPEAARRDRVVSSIHAAAKGTVNFEHFLQARRGNSRVGVVWGQPLPGRNANVWPPALESGEPESTSDLLLKALSGRLAAAGLVIAQAMLPRSATDVVNILSRNGFMLVANLVYLLWKVAPFPTELVSDLRFVEFQDSLAPRFEAVIATTYVDSHDAPNMDGLRTIQDAVAGYKATGQFSPERWFLVESAGKDAGCLLLTDHPDLNIWELVYMGLVPESRGRGWGTKLVRFAQQRALAAGAESLLVSVDAANHPAVAAYTRCGFSEIDRRQIWVTKLAANQESL